jgi:hypothetical protein
LRGGVIVGSVAELAVGNTIADPEYEFRCELGTVTLEYVPVTGFSEDSNETEDLIKIAYLLNRLAKIKKFLQLENL